jgi:hypothetical protein
MIVRGAPGIYPEESSIPSRKRARRVVCAVFTRPNAAFGAVFALLTQRKQSHGIRQGRFPRGDAMIKHRQDRVRLTIPIGDAISFAMGWTDLGYSDPHDGLRQIVGLLAVDALQYSEQWRVAAMLRTCLEHRWPTLGE